MKAKKALGSTLASLGFAVSFAALASAAPGSTIGTTGPDSYNKVKNTSSQSLMVRNTNDIGVRNTNHQSSWSGEAKVVHNTTGGGATTGSASNANALSASATVNNAATTAPAVAAVVANNVVSNTTSAITETGPDSTNKVENTTMSKVYVHNDNNLSVDNSNCQTAKSGDAIVADNTTGGSATTGNVSNTNTTTVSFNVSN